jgi:hypothetical protein
MKSSRIFSTAKLLLAILVFATLTSGMSAAQNTLKGTFQLDKEAHWSGALLPPGAYSFTIDSMQIPTRTVVRSADGKILLTASTSITGDPVSKDSFILISNNGTRRQVRSLNLPQIGISLDFSPMTSAGKEYLSKVKTATVPVNIASR